MMARRGRRDMRDPARGQGGVLWISVTLGGGVQGSSPSMMASSSGVGRTNLWEACRSMVERKEAVGVELGVGVVEGMVEEEVG